MAELSLSELQTFDSHSMRKGTEQRFCCPLPACAGKPINASHRSLTVNMETGAWNCKRCGEKGKLQEYHTERPVSVSSRRERSARELQQWVGLSPSSREPGRAGREQAAAPAEQAEASTAASSAPSSADNALLGNVTFAPIDQAGAVETARGAQWREAIRGLLNLPDTLAASYLQGRGLSVELGQASGARYHPKFYGRPALLFPIRNASGELVAVQGRYVDGGSDPKARTAGKLADGAFWTPGALDALTSASRSPLVICEAPIDALSIAACGLPALALCGTTLRPWLLRRCIVRSVFLAFDADEAGDKAAVQWGAALAGYTSHIQRLRPIAGKDWNELMTTRGAASLQAFVAALDGALIANRLPINAASVQADRQQRPFQTRPAGSAQRHGEQAAAPIDQAEASRPGALDADREKPALRLWQASGDARPSSAAKRQTGPVALDGPADSEHAEELPGALVPFAALVQAARRGLLPGQPVRLDGGLTVQDVAAKVLLHVEDVKRAEAGDRLLKAALPVILRDMQTLLRWFNEQTLPIAP